MRCAWIITAALLLSAALQQEIEAQVSDGSANSFISPRQTSLAFSRELNIYAWKYRLQYHKQLGERLRVQADEDFRSTLQRIAKQDLWKDEHAFNFLFGYQLSPRWVARSQFTSQILSDALAGFDNDIKYHAGGFGISYKPSAHLELGSDVSAKWQSQLKQSDTGLGFSAHGNVDNFDYNGYRNNLVLSGQQDYFPRRKNADLTFRYSIQRQFYESTGDTLTLVAERLHRDSFDADGGRIFVRNLSQTRRGIENRLSYRLSSRGTFFMKNAFLANTYKVTNVLDDSSSLRKDDSGFESRHTASVALRTDRWLGDVNWTYRLRSRTDRRPREQKADPFGRFPTVGFDTEDILVRLSVHNGLNLGGRDSLGLYSAVSKFQYDSSDTTNPNDHDQIKWDVTLVHSHHFSSALCMTWEVSAFLNHFVFISRKFSGDNNWERNFQLSPEIVYTPASRFSFRQRFLVRAKYQTFDFDDAATSNRNIVNRQFIVTNSSAYKLSEKGKLELSLNIELAEQGKLFYNLWRQRLALSWRNTEVQLLYRGSLGSGWRIASGGSLFKQTRWDHRSNGNGGLTRVVRSKHTNFGPLWELAYRPSPALELMFVGNIQVSKSSRSNTENIRNLDLSLHWFL